MRKQIQDVPFAGFAPTNMTQVPDEFFDVLAPQLGEAELRVALYIFRRTFGFKKQSDAISLKQMVEGIVKRDGTRLDSGAGVARSAAVRAVKGLVARGIIEARRNQSRAKGDEPTTYTLRFRTQPVTATETRGSAPGEHGGVSSEDSQGTGEQDAARQETDASKSFTSKWQAILAAKDRGEEPRELAHASSPSRLTHGPSKVERPAASARIDAAVTAFSADLADTEHARANCTQARRLLARSGLAEGQFEQCLYEARAITRDEIQRRRAAGTGTPVAKPMPFFFAVLRDLLHLDDGPGGDSAKQGSLASSAARQTTSNAPPDR